MSRTTKQNLREEYLSWLGSQFKDERDNPDKTYWDLINLMFDTPFGWVSSVPMDENRLGDAMDLRWEFSRDSRARREDLQALAAPSFFEVLIALSRHLAFVAGGQAPGWAWVLVKNLELERMWDPLTSPKRRKAQEAMNVVIERRYSPDGTGGFFPLAWPDDDQTKIELWYQLNAFVEELHPEH